MPQLIYSLYGNGIEENSTFEARVKHAITLIDNLVKIVEPSTQNDDFRVFAVNDPRQAIQSIKNADPSSEDITDRANDALEIIRKAQFSINEMEWRISVPKKLRIDEFWSMIMEEIYAAMEDLACNLISMKERFPRISDYEMEFELMDGRVARAKNHPAYN